MTYNRAKLYLAIELGIDHPLTYSEYRNYVKFGNIYGKRLPKSRTFDKPFSTWNKSLGTGLHRKDKHTELKHEIISAYGGKCVCCGEMIEEFLTIDHVNGDGSEHRKLLKLNNTVRFYFWLKEHNFPRENFQILCYNCNFAKGKNRMCPHQRLKLTKVV